ncbi:MAG TPA: tetratricopeptide repeat protein [Candidatus Polarisedimenticolia bacterium]|nr:tetratricopeptide repeat protein [Candidatus Polarisedimenticolia bacterium]
MTPPRASFPLFAIGLAAAVALVASPPASPAAVAPESVQWIRYQSPNFNVYSSAPERRTEDFIVRLERFREVLGTIFPSFEVTSPVETTVFVFKSWPTMEPFAPRYGGKTVTIDGQFTWSRDENFVVVNGSGTDDHMPVVYHEYMHYFTMRNLPPLPPWFGEGIAECYETFRTDGKTAELGRGKVEHILYLRQVPFMPLDQLFAVRHDSPEYNEGDRRSVFYAESWALVHYLIWDTAKYRQKLVAFLDRLGSGEDSQQAFVGAFGTSPADLQAELRRNLEHGQYLKSVVTLKGPPVEASVRKSPVSKGEIQARLGDLLAHSADERSGDAESYLDAALAAEPDNAVALRALALVRRGQGKPDEARALLEKRLAADPHDGMAAWSLGEQLTDQDATAPRARSLLRGAATDRPDIPEIAVAYGRSLLSGPPEPSEAELDHAIALLNVARDKLRYRADVLATQAVLLAARGNFPAAESLVTRALPVLGDKEALSWARASLDQFRRRAQAEEEYQRRLAGDTTAAGESAAEPGAPGTPEDAGAVAPADDASIPADVANRDIDTYNKGIALANQRNYAGALALLEPLYLSTRVPELKDRLGPLLADLRKRAGRK